MALTEEMHDDVAVLALLVGSLETDEFFNKIKALVDSGVNKVVADIRKVMCLNSTSLGALLAASYFLVHAHGDLKLVRITDKVESLFVKSQLSKYFSCFGTIDEAVKSFSSPN